MVAQITPLPTPPQRNDSAQFRERGDAFLAALPGFQAEANALAVEVNEKAVAASDSATTAEQHKDAAEQAAIATAEDALATAADRAQTGLDAQATAADRVQTGLDRVATAEDRVQTGIDRQAVEDALASIADGPVTSVNGKTGVVSLTATDIAPLATQDEMKAGVEVEPRSMSPELVALAAEEITRELVPQLVPGEQILIVIDEKPSGTHGGTNSTGQWQVRDLNTVVVNTIPGASLSGNLITLPAGTYHINGRAPSAGTAGHKARLYDLSTSSVLLDGSSGASNQNAINNIDSVLNAVCSISSPRQLALEHRTSVSKTGTGFGWGNSFPDAPEIYSQLVIRRLA